MKKDQLTNSLSIQVSPPDRWQGGETRCSQRPSQLSNSASVTFPPFPSTEVQSEILQFLWGIRDGQLPAVVAFQTASESKGKGIEFWWWNFRASSLFFFRGWEGSGYLRSGNYNCICIASLYKWVIQSAVVVIITWSVTTWRCSHCAEHSSRQLPGLPCLTLTAGSPPTPSGVVPAWHHGREPKEICHLGRWARLELYTECCSL